MRTLYIAKALLYMFNFHDEYQRKEVEREKSDEKVKLKWNGKKEKKKAHQNMDENVCNRMWIIMSIINNWLFSSLINCPLYFNARLTVYYIYGTLPSVVIGLK